MRIHDLESHLANWPTRNDRPLSVTYHHFKNHRNDGAPSVVFQQRPPTKSLLEGEGGRQRQLQTKFRVTYAQSLRMRAHAHTQLHTTQGSRKESQLRKGIFNFRLTSAVLRHWLAESPEAKVKRQLRRCALSQRPSLQLGG